MSLQNHNSIWLNQRLKELKSESPERTQEFIAFEKFAETLTELYANRGIDLWVSDVKLQDSEIAYEIKAQAQSINPETLELLERLTNA